MPASNLALYAQWRAKTIIVTFVTGENATQIPEQQFEANHVARKPEDPERTHYRFVGWTMDEAGTQPFNFDQILTKDLTLYAQCRKTRKDFSAGIQRQMVPVWIITRGMNL